MPSTSKAQHKFMTAVANSPSFAKKAGVPRSVGKDFTAADKTLKLPTSTRNRADLQKVNNPKTNQGRNELFNKGGDTMATKMNPGMMAMMAKKKGMHKMPDGKMMKNSAMNMGGMTKMAGGGMPMKDGKPAFIGDGQGAMKMGGTALAKHAAKPASKAHAGLKDGGYVRAADGVASKGKTKATQIKMKSGGAAC